jgi:ribonuclease BN (tRNA processing enzyme)
MQVHFIGCGDAFGSGGRFNTCFHVTGPGCNFLIDCGATTLTALKRTEIDLNAIDTILISHFHGDHMGGLPGFVLDAQFASKRTGPLTIAGPEGLEDWYVRAADAAFYGASKNVPKFDLNFLELEPRVSARLGALKVTPYPVVHGDPGGPCFALRIETGGKTLVYTGDTEWTDTLIEAGRGADLLIAEAYYYDKRVPFHLDLKTLEAHLDKIAPKRLILTHMSDDMLSRTDNIGHECAYDGLKIAI